MFIRQLKFGPMQNLVYLIGDSKTRECLVVDPAWDAEELLKVIDEADLRLKGALISHYHPDHCGGHLWGHDIEGVAELIGLRPVPVYCEKHEAEGLMKITGLSRTDLSLTQNGESLKVGEVEIKIIHTPGHTPGSQCFLVGDALISGDTLFLTGCGRVDLPGGNPEHMYESLTHTLGKIDDSVILYPGHSYGGLKASMGEVKKQVPYLLSKSFGEFQGLYGGRS